MNIVHEERGAATFTQHSHEVNHGHSFAHARMHLKTPYSFKQLRLCSRSSLEIRGHLPETLGGDDLQVRLDDRGHRELWSCAGYLLASSDTPIALKRRIQPEIAPRNARPEHTPSQSSRPTLDSCESFGSLQALWEASLLPRINERLNPARARD